MAFADLIKLCRKVSDRSEEATKTLSETSDTEKIQARLPMSRLQTSASPLYKTPEEAKEAANKPDKIEKDFFILNLIKYVAGR